jgi:hypothetical protein
MVLSYKKFNESVQEKEINFIPFKLREELDPNFVWDAETEDRAYHHYKIQDKKPLHLSIEYIREMGRRLIGKHISFYAYDYEKCKVNKNHGIVEEMGYNASGILCLDLVSPGGTRIPSKGALDERKPITNYVYEEEINKRPDIDPYGEDNWDDEWDD